MSEIAANTGGSAGEWRERLGRAGFVAKGILYVIVGIVAIAVSLGEEKKTADQTGALASLGESSAGNLLLVVLAIGLGSYALFRLIEVFIGPADDEGAKEGLMRAASAVRAVVYGGLCVAAIRLATDSGTSSGNEKSSTSTAFDLPAGVALVFAAGVVLVGVGFYQAYKSASTDFEDDLEVGRMSARMRSAARVMGVAGYAARSVVYVLIGGFLIKAAVEHDATEAIGLDGALQETSQQPFGSFLLFVLAAGLLIYGGYSLIEARYRKL